MVPLGCKGTWDTQALVGELLPSTHFTRWTGESESSAHLCHSNLYYLLHYYNTNQAEIKYAFLKYVLIY